MKFKTVLLIASTSALLVWLFNDAGALASYISQYADPNFRNSFLNARLEAFQHSGLWRNSFWIHALVGTLILFSGGLAWLYYYFYRFSKKPLPAVRTLHRYLGRVYTYTILFISAPTGFVMAFYAQGGTVVKINFVVLSLLWFWVTWRGYQEAKKLQWVNHGSLMTLSLGLSFSAIVQRRIVYFYPLLANLLDWDESYRVYPVSAVLGWIMSFSVSLGIARLAFKKSPLQLLKLTYRFK